MKTIGLVALRKDTAFFLKNQLDHFLDGLVITNVYILSEIETRVTLTDESLLLFTGLDSYQEADKKLSYQCEGIIANRSINYNAIDPIFLIPEGTKVYLLNDYKSSAIQTVAYLKALGINHIEYIPLYPEAEINRSIETLITLGEYDYIPKDVKNVIDIGIRTIDISTLVETLVRLHISSTKIGLFATKYIKDIIALTNMLKNTNSHNEYNKNKLATILDSVNDGILAIDSQNCISIFNNMAEAIFQCGRGLLSGKNVDKLLLQGNGKYDFIRSVMETNDDIVSYLGKRLVVNSTSIVHNNGNVERVFIIKEVTEIQKLEQKLRMKISQNRYLARYTFDDILGSSEAIRVQKAMAKKISRFDSPVYIYGESGTGKELFAQAIHLSSSRKDGPFVAVNFAAIAESLVESELFGYVEGAFTGAKKGGVPGIFEQAHGGTVFLDEIGDAPLNFQIKLLRVLQEKQVRRIGDNKLIPVDTRIIVATNKDIAQLVAEGRFREDLFYRINVLPLHIPSLRERKSDIEEFSRVFYDEFVQNIHVSKDFDYFFQDVRSVILHYDFPGNVRQLRNTIEYLVYTSENGRAVKEALQKEFFQESRSWPQPSPQPGRQSSYQSSHQSRPQSSCQSRPQSSYQSRLLPSLQPNAATLEMLCLNLIFRRNAEVKSVGRRSLSAELNCSEAKIKTAVHSLESREFIIVHKGRKGIKISQKGIDHLNTLDMQ